MKFQKIGTSLSHITFPAIIQQKYDGMRANYFVDSPNKGFFLNKSDFKLHFNSTLPPGQYDGELIIPGKTRAESNGLFNSAFKKTGLFPSNGLFIIFDIINPEIFLTYQEKLKLLKILNNGIFPNFKIIKSHIIESQNDIQEWKQKAINENLEGFVIKNFLLKWSPFRTSHAYKLKITHEIIMRVIDLAKGEGKHSNRLGAVFAQGLNENQAISAKIGTGFDDSQRESIWAAQSTGFLIEVEYQEKSNNSLIHPVFKRFVNED